MFRKIILLSALAAGFSTLGAGASVLQREEPHKTARTVPDGIKLAQEGDVEVYYDEYGRRVVVDAYTGEVLSVERPRQAERREQRRHARRQQQEERYYLDDPDDMERLRQERLRDGYPDGPAINNSEDYSREPPDGTDEGFPEPPRRAFPEDQGEPEIIAREPVEREPVARQPIERAPLGDGAMVKQAPPVAAEPPAIIDKAVEPSLSFNAREDVAALQILLDRKGASPGVIDGKFGSNVDKAIVAYRSITNENLKSTDAEGIKKALAASGGNAFTTYTIAAGDAAGPFVASVPADYGEKAKLDRLGYTSVPEMLAERFHMDETYLRALNPEANFSRVGTIIKVANIGQPTTRQVARIVADKGKKQVFAYDAAGKLVVSYPATIGSTDTPSPTGSHAISRIVADPDYTYNPNLNFKQGDNTKILTIPPGPNGPVGSIWIALDKPTYGIHGTPDPSKIGKTESHGCVRLTNWDAQELSKIVKPGVMVEFAE